MATTRTGSSFGPEMEKSTMNARIATLTTVLALSAILALPTQASAATYEIDSGHSAVLFRIKHLNAAWQYGRFVQVSGSIVFDEANPAASSIHVTIDAASVATFDPNRDRHLKSPDFFNVKQFPTITFRSKKVEAAGGDQYKVTGDLTLHGVTREIEVTFAYTGSGSDPHGNFRAGWESRFTLQRSHYDMNFMLGPLSDEVGLIISLEAIRK